MRCSFNMRSGECRRALVCSLALFFCTPLLATDISDLWWNPAESGWGVNVAQQERILFITFFVYGPDGRPSWLVAPNTQFQQADASNVLIFSGPLYQTSGPWFGSGAFNPNAVGATEVGAVTFRLTTVNDATITYSVSGVAINKVLIRQTFRANSWIPGHYLGALMKVSDSCSAVQKDETFTTIDISLSSGAMNLSVTSSSATCTFSGRYTQTGRLGSFSGPVACVPVANPATNHFFEIEATSSGISGRFETVSLNGCKASGHFAGSRR
jgi:hypothetical protein